MTAWPTIAEDADFSAADYNCWIAAVNERRAAVGLSALPLLAEDDRWSRHNVSDLQAALEALAPSYFNTSAYADPAAEMEGKGDVELPADFHYSASSMLAAAGLASGWRKKIGSLAAAFTFGQCAEDDLEGTWELEDLKAVCQALKCTEAAPSSGWSGASNFRHGEAKAYGDPPVWGAAFLAAIADSKASTVAAFDAGTAYDSACPAAFTVQHYGADYTNDYAQTFMLHRRAIPWWGIYTAAQAIPRSVKALVEPWGVIALFNGMSKSHSWPTIPSGASDVADLNGDLSGFTFAKWHVVETLASGTGATAQFLNYVGPTAGNLANHPTWCDNPTFTYSGCRGYTTLARAVFTWGFAYA